MPGLIPPYYYNFTNPTLPKFYYEVKSQEQLLATISCALEGLTKHENAVTDNVNVNTEDIEELQKYVEAIQNGEYVDGYIDQLAAYIDANLTDLVGRIAQYVFPSFYWDGDCWRYMVVVPTNWDWLRFRWVWDQEDGTYHIALGYTVTNEQVEDYNPNPGSGNEQDIAALKKKINEVSSSLQTSINYMAGYKEG